MKEKRDKIPHGFVRDKRLLNELANSSPRSKVIVAGSVMDLLLERLLRNYLLENKKLLADIFDGASGMLSNFSSKIKMAYLSGLISKEIYNDLEILRSIRNHFAHGLYGSDFTEKYIEDLCKRFFFVQKVFPPNSGVEESMDRLFTLEMIILEVALIKKIVRVKRVVEMNCEINDLAFEDIDNKYLANE